MTILQIIANLGFVNIAHRGARSLAPENTLPAASKAFDAGAHLWELDVAMTRDGELLVVHDSTLDRTSDARSLFPTRSPWAVCDFTLDEIRRLDFGSWFVREDPFGQIRSGAVALHELNTYCGLQAPTLAEALDFTRRLGWALNIEIKDLSGTLGHSVVARKVAALVDAMSMGDSVIISSFNHAYLEEIRRLDAGFHLGVLINRRISNPIKTLRRLGALAYHPRVSALQPKETERLRNEGFHVFPWVVNDRDSFIRLRQEKVSGVFTDFPQDLNSFLMRMP